MPVSWFCASGRYATGTASSPSRRTCCRARRRRSRPRPLRPVEADALADGVAAGEVHARGRLVDDRPPAGASRRPRREVAAVTAAGCRSSRRSAGPTTFALMTVASPRDAAASRHGLVRRRAPFDVQADTRPLPPSSATRATLADSTPGRRSHARRRCDRTRALDARVAQQVDAERRGDEPLHVEAGVDRPARPAGCARRAPPRSAAAARARPPRRPGASSGRSGAALVAATGASLSAGTRPAATRERRRHAEQTPGHDRRAAARTRARADRSRSRAASGKRAGGRRRRPERLQQGPAASARPAMPPTSESSTLSVSSCRTSRPRLAPSASRTASSRRRAAPRQQQVGDVRARDQQHRRRPRRRAGAPPERICGRGREVRVVHGTKRARRVSPGGSSSRVGVGEHGSSSARAARR